MKQICKHCCRTNTVKNGIQKGRQNYFCKDCNRNFVPPRDKSSYEAIKKLAVILYGSGGNSFNYLASLFGVCPATVYNWVKKYAEDLEEMKVSPHIKEIEIDEMWHFIRSKKTRCGSLKPLIVQAERQLHMLQAGETLQQFVNYTTK